MKKMRKAAILAMLISVIFMFTAGLAIAQEEIEDAGNNLVIAPAPDGPIANFEYKVEGRTISFGSTSGDADGIITAYLWEFPDGTNSTEQHPSKEFAKDNTYYTVNLTVTDNNNKTAKITQNVQTGDTSNNKKMVILGCALALGIAGISAAIGLGISGSAAIAVTAEKPEIFSKLLILQVLPMTQSVYGLLTAILLMMGSGLIGGGDATVTPLMGMGAVWIGLVVGLTGTSAINQGMTAASSISAVGRNPDVVSKGIIFTVMTETIAIFGLLLGILLMVGLGFLG